MLICLCATIKITNYFFIEFTNEDIYTIMYKYSLGTYSSKNIQICTEKQFYFIWK